MRASDRTSAAAKSGSRTPVASMLSPLVSDGSGITCLDAREHHRFVHEAITKHFSNFGGCQILRKPAKQIVTREHRPKTLLKGRSCIPPKHGLIAWVCGIGHGIGQKPRRLQRRA
jgi:hypothetical protein